MSNFQSALVQFAYYGAYFALAIPAALINKRFGYKAGVLTGLGLATVGGFLFIPAGMLLEYGFFLVALFVLAAGLSILETSANPFVISMGPEVTATQRLNLAQAFNPVGANIGVLLGAVLILPNITPEAEKAEMSAQQLEQAQETDLSLVLGPYTGIAIALLLIWLLIAFRKINVPDDHVHFGLEEQSGGAFGAAVAQPPLPVRRGRAVPQRRGPGLRVELHHPVRPGRRRRPRVAGRVVPAGEPHPVPDLALRDDLPARHHAADQAACSPWGCSAWCSRSSPCSCRTWSV